MQCYKYDIGGRFIEAVEVMLSPVDESPMLPFGSTLIAPAEPEPGCYVAFAEGEWHQIENPVTPPPVPQIISMRQCQLYLDKMEPIGGLNVLDIIDGYVETQPRPWQIEWAKSDEVWRSSPMVEQMRQMFGWPVEQMDQMFLEASQS